MVLQRQNNGKGLSTRIYIECYGSCLVYGKMDCYPLWVFVQNNAFTVTDFISKTLVWWRNMHYDFKGCNSFDLDLHVLFRVGASNQGVHGECFDLDNKDRIFGRNPAVGCQSIRR